MHRRLCKRFLWRQYLRGGSWNNNANNTRSANRNNNRPENRNNNNGFRVAKTENAGVFGRNVKERAPFVHCLLPVKAQSKHYFAIFGSSVLVFNINIKTYFIVLSSLFLLSLISCSKLRVCLYCLSKKCKSSWYSGKVLCMRFFVSALSTYFC